MGKIYKIVNDVNSKIYIGKTTRSLQTRFEEHIKNTSNYKSAISAAIQKYGEKHFQIQLIEDNIPDEQLNQKERYWINFYDSYRKGYNLTPGGDGKSLSDEEIADIRQLWELGLSCSEISNKLDLPHSTVYHRICKYPEYSVEENRKRAKKDQYKEISQYNEQGKFIQKFYSITAASNQLKISDKQICTGAKKGYKVHGFYFAYGDEPLIIKTNKKRVYQYDKQGNLLNIFNGVRQAGRQTGIDYTGILKNCNGKYKTSGGYIWSYDQR